jgi:hypothetical protein
VPVPHGAINSAIRLRVVIGVVTIGVVLRNLVETDLQIATDNWRCRRMLLSKSFRLHGGGVSGAKFDARNGDGPRLGASHSKRGLPDSMRNERRKLSTSKSS